MIDKLELLLALARERHFGRAADASGVTQPTLSSALKSLEDQFGVLIVERGSRFRCFTPEGERVLDWARRIVGDARAMRQEIDALKKGLSGHLRLAVIPTSLPFLAELTVPMRRRYPDVNLTILSMTSDSILTRLENLEVDIGISYVDAEPPPRFETIQFYDEHYVLLVAPESPLAKREQVTWAEAGQLPLCLLTPDMQNRRLIDHHLAEAGVHQKPTLESNSMLILYAHVMSGEWASILPSRLAETLDRPSRLRSISLVNPTVTHKIGLIVTKREPHSPVVAAFIALAKRIGNLTKATTSRKET
ncbi:MAG: LysR family transcriptional regulator [Hyphomicrobium zavarzinii]|jgi:DNA-binding transcriptional LysR family regulator|uniref:LysR family transcriptional regulator n=1 Tax=Hyphomicrobium TaxID=81 RepID=UPI000684A287|nr:MULTISPECIES: LysR family transcriptional regulator [Hyphomicrobium]MBL8846587.1 LysR family transcriptional regulator [Hyphomicrobium zavarzinii]WBT36727.1 LysR family transcriptional regulator [Hyphomicrobium sp. DMF-1]